MHNAKTTTHEERYILSDNIHGIRRLQFARSKENDSAHRGWQRAKDSAAGKQDTH
jgi:hypothetical protein